MTYHTGTGPVAKGAAQNNPAVREAHKKANYALTKAAGDQFFRPPDGGYTGRHGKQSSNRKN